MQLFYAPNINEQNNNYTFNKDESKHIVKVLRKKNGDKLYLTNGKGQFFTSEIILDDTKKCTVKIITITTQQRPNYNLHLAVAPTKMNDRYEWFLEKVTEIGITEITPIICEHSERKVIKKERLQKILESAMKQSLNCYLPKLNDTISFKEFITKAYSSKKYIAHCEETNKLSFKNDIEAQKDTLVLIGPEGDFSTKEIELALTNSFKPVSLGKTRLRTETAAIVACHSVAFINE